MAKVNNIVTINPEIEEFASGAMGMRDAIIRFAEMGNPHAIKAEEAAMAGASTKDFSNWKFYVEQLRMAAIESGKVCDRQDAKTEDIKKATDKLIAKWYQVLANAEEFHQRMFLRSTDEGILRTYACNSTFLTVSGLGTIPTVTSATNFRKMVERFVGVRLRAQEALDDHDRDLIMKVSGLERTIQTCMDRLNGTDKGDTHVAGLLETLDNLRNKLTESVQLLSGFGISDADIWKNPAVAAMQTSVKATEAAIASTKKTLKESEDGLAELKDKYDTIIAGINKIEAVAKK